MYSHQEAARIRQEFWTAFGQYMSLHTSYEGMKINWINYKTGVPGISFKTDCIDDKAIIAIVISHPDKDIQELYYEQFLQLKTMLQQAVHEEWHWELPATDEQGKAVSRIYKEADNLNLMNRNHWPDIISFFKPRLIALDEFWSTARYAFEALR